YLPWTMSTSGKLTPAARTATSTRPGPGTGEGTSSTTRLLGGPQALHSTAFMYDAIITRRAALPRAGIRRYHRATRNARREAVMAETAAAKPVKYVGFWKRLAASIIDTVILIVVVVIVALPFYGPQYFQLSQEGKTMAFDFVMQILLPLVAAILFW